MIKKKTLFIILICFITFAFFIINYFDLLKSGLKAPEDLYKVDKGIIVASKNGHHMLNNVVINENGYTLKFEDIFIDSDRIEMLVTLIDNNIENYKYIYGKSYINETDEKYFTDNFEEDLTETKRKYLGLDINIAGFEGKIIFTTTDVYYSNYNIKKLSCYYSYSFFKDYIIDNKGCLVVKAHVYNENRETLYDFNNINIHFDKEKIPEPKIYDVKEDVSTKYGFIKLDKLIISSSRITLTTKSNLLYCDYTSVINQIWLEDEKGRKISQSDTGTINLSSNADDGISYYFYPSIYYTNVKEIFVVINGTKYKVEIS